MKEVWPEISTEKFTSICQEGLKHESTVFTEHETLDEAINCIRTLSKTTFKGCNWVNSAVVYPVGASDYDLERYIGRSKKIIPIKEDKS